MYICRRGQYYKRCEISKEFRILLSRAGERQVSSLFIHTGNQTAFNNLLDGRFSGGCIIAVGCEV